MIKARSKSYIVYQFSFAECNSKYIGKAEPNFCLQLEENATKTVQFSTTTLTVRTTNMYIKKLVLYR